MKYCICGIEISEDQTYCPSCRATVRYQDLPGHGELTCDNCFGYCPYRGDAYNTHGDCLLEK
jgi:hypothetical protein